MNEQEQRIKIAEACGWKGITKSNGLWSTSPPLIEGYNPKRPESWEQICRDTPRERLGEIPLDEIPDYLSDLNAMHEAEKVLTVSQEAEFAELLHELSPDCFSHLHKDFRAIHATAAQRAEAFLRTMARHARQ